VLRNFGGPKYLTMKILLYKSIILFLLIYQSVSQSLLYGQCLENVEIGNDTIIYQGVTLEIGVKNDVFESYLWKEGQTGPYLYVSSSGVNWIEATDASGCVSTDTVVVLYIEEPSLGLGNDITSCNGTSVDLVANEGFAYYEWSTGETSRSISVTETGNYSVSAYYKSSENLLVNASFEKGNAGFTSEYNFEVPGYGGYIITDASEVLYSGASPCNDNEIVDGYFMAIEGNNVAGSKIWSQTVAVQPNTNYLLSTQITAINPDFLPELVFYINDVPLDKTVSPTSLTCKWEEIGQVWNSGSNTQVEVSLINNNLEIDGNDFAIDNLFFGSMLSKTDEISVDFSGLPGISLADTATCDGINIFLGEDNPTEYNYIWSNGATTPSIAVSLPGVYSVTVSNNNCSIERSITVHPKICDEDAFICDGDYYLSTRNNLKGQLNEVNLTGNTPTFTPLGPVQYAFNALAYNRIDNYLYAINHSGEMIKIRANGTSIVLGVPDGLKPFEHYVADINDQGVYVLRNVNDKKIYFIDVLNSIPPKVIGTLDPSAPIEASDIAVEPLTGDIYGYDKQYLLKMDPVTGKVERIGPYQGDKANTIGALWFDAFGELWGYGKTSASSPRHNTLFRIDVNTGIVTRVAAGPNADGIDGAACPYNVQMKLITDKRTYIEGDTIEFILTIYNNTYIELPNLTLYDIIPEDILIVDQPDTFLGGTIAAGTGVGTNTIRYENVTLPGQETILRFKGLAPCIDVDSLAWKTQARLLGLPSSYGNEVLSDYPPSPAKVDSTPFSIYNIEAPIVHVEDTVCENTGVSVTIQSDYDNVEVETPMNQPNSNVQYIPISQAKEEHIGWYKAEVRNNACFERDSSHLHVVPLPEVVLPPDTAICDGEEVTIEANGTYEKIVWNTGETDNSITVHTPWRYRADVSNWQCKTTEYVRVYVNPIPELDLGNEHAFCTDEAIISTNNKDADSYLWSTGETTNTISVTKSGMYSLTITEDDCENSDDVYVHMADKIEIDLGPDTTMCNTGTVTFTPGFGFDTFNWSTGDNSQTLTVNKPGKYSVTVSDGICTASDSVTVTMISPVKPAISIVADNELICETDPIIVSADFVSDEGSNPQYTWFVNNIIVASDVDEIRIDTLTKNSQVTLMLENNDYCVEPPQVRDSVNIKVIEIVRPSVTINAIPNNPCEFTPTTIRANGEHTGTNAIYEWFVNGNKQSESSSIFNSSTLAGNSEVVVKMTSTAECPSPVHVYDTIKVLKRPDPQIEDKDVCDTDEPFEITAKNGTNSGGSFEVISSSGVVQTADNQYSFMPNYADLGDNEVVIEWTDDYGCIAQGSATITVHTVEAPVVEDYLEDIIGVLPYKHFTAVGDNRIFWSDEEGNVISTDNEYYPSETCSNPECTFNYWVTQVLDPYGCEKTVEVVYSLSQCVVPPPVVSSSVICDTDEIPVLDAKVQDNWENGVNVGNSTLYWYLFQDDTTSKFFEGEGFIPASKEPEVQNYWVRQYNDSYNCLSPPRKVQLLINHANPPVVNDREICDNEDIQPFIAVSPFPKRWYQTATSTTVLSTENVFAAPSKVNSTFYVSQIENDCESERVPVSLFIHPVPLPPILSPDENCEGEAHYLQAETDPDYDLFWFNSNDVMISNNKTLSLDDSQLKMDDSTHFKAYVKNEWGCESEYEHTTYYLISVPDKPLIAGDNEICEMQTINALTASTSLPYDKLEWTTPNGVFLANGETYQPDSLPPGVYAYEVTAYNQYCLSSNIKKIAIRPSPVPEIDGSRRVCAYTADKSYVAKNPINGLVYNWGVSNDLKIASRGTPFAVSVDFGKQGLDTITLYATDNLGCEGYDTVIVKVADNPIADFDFFKQDNVSNNVNFWNTSIETVIKDGDFELNLESDFYWNFGIDSLNVQTRKNPVLFSGLYDYPTYQPFEKKDEDTTLFYTYGKYPVSMIAINDFGCRDTVEKEIFVDVYQTLYIPNTVCPTHYNAYVATFRPKGLGLEKFDLWVYDEWGNIIWHTDDLKKGQPVGEWDCRYDGKLIQQGYYIWKAEASFRDGTIWEGQESNKGDISKMGHIFVFY